jgi:nitrite reductase/ring-hydroxylating ferredoxin subunit
MATVSEIPEGGMILPIHENKFVMRAKANDEIYAIDGICIFCML